MTLNLSRYINKTIFVSIRTPSNGDCKCVPYKLIGLELLGLWLDGPDLTKDFIAREYKSAASVNWRFFVPFSQIACVAIAEATAATQSDGAHPSQSKTQSAPAAAVVRETTAATTAATQKKPKSKEA
jgi:hypothetical protein